MHDLGAINAAIKLGDIPLPPIGARLLIPMPHNLISLDCKVLSYETTFSTRLVVEPRYDEDGRCEIVGYAYIRENGYRILSLPRETPPFEEWERD